MRQFFLFSPYYLLVKFNLEGQTRFCKLKALIDRRVSRLRNFLLTGILPYTGFTFAAPKHQSYIILYSTIVYCTVLYCTSDRAASLKVLFFGTPYHYFITALFLVVSSTYIYISVSIYTRIFFDTYIITNRIPVMAPILAPILGVHFLGEHISLKKWDLPPFKPRFKLFQGHVLSY
jgi:hypothetical protein